MAHQMVNARLLFVAGGGFPCGHVVRAVRDKLAGARGQIRIHNAPFDTNDDQCTLLFLTRREKVGRSPGRAVLESPGHDRPTAWQCNLSNEG